MSEVVKGSAYSVRHYGAANAITILRSNGQFFTLNEDETRWLAEELRPYLDDQGRGES